LHFGWRLPVIRWLLSLGHREAASALLCEIDETDSRTRFRSVWELTQAAIAHLCGMPAAEIDGRFGVTLPVPLDRVLMDDTDEMPLWLALCAAHDGHPAGLRAWNGLIVDHPHYLRARAAWTANTSPAIEPGEPPFCRAFAPN
jgi:hypothetical protein